MIGSLMAFKDMFNRLVEEGRRMDLWSVTGATPALHDPKRSSRDLYFRRFIYIAARFFISATAPLRDLPRIPGIFRKPLGRGAKKTGLSELILGQLWAIFGPNYKNRRHDVRGEGL
ncbi:MAG TPA: hypothetical protein VGN42_02185 [Pirellulales bacterium]|nr:hypothetical protein [Pirellulales bacterium]